MVYWDWLLRSSSMSVPLATYRALAIAAYIQHVTYAFLIVAFVLVALVAMLPTCEDTLVCTWYSVDHTLDEVAVVVDNFASHADWNSWC